MRQLILYINTAYLHMLLPMFQHNTIMSWYKLIIRSFVLFSKDTIFWGVFSSLSLFHSISIEDDILKLLKQPQAWLINDDSWIGHMVPSSILMQLIVLVCLFFIILDCSWASNYVIICYVMHEDLIVTDWERMILIT